MDTMAFVEKFLQGHEHEYIRNMEERTFDCAFEGKFIDIQLEIDCPEINEEENIYFDEISSFAILDCNVPEDKTGEVMAFINHVVEEAGNTFAKIFLFKNHIIATYRFFVWDEMSDEQLDLMLFSPVRYILDYEEDFLRILVGDEEEETDKNQK